MAIVNRIRTDLEDFCWNKMWGYGICHIQELEEQIKMETHTREKKQLLRTKQNTKTYIQNLLKKLNTQKKTQDPLLLLQVS